MQSIDLFLGLFSGFGRSLIWVVDNVVEFVRLCTYFMVNERFISDIFRATFPHNFCRSFAEINSVKCFFALKTSGYLFFLARHLISFASHEYEDIFILGDLSAINFQQLVNNRLNEFQPN